MLEMNTKNRRNSSKANFSDSKQWKISAQITSFEFDEHCWKNVKTFKFHEKIELSY